jgi:hypothetical protein
MQGNVQQGGANYTETLLATVHNTHIALLTFIAPQSVYSDEDRLAFADIRASLRFV